MIAYEELVVALTNWRIKQGLPTSAVNFLSQDTGSVDLSLPVADPLAVSGEAQELSAEQYIEGEEDSIEEISAEEYAGEVAEEPAAPEGYAVEEVATDVYAAEGSTDDPIAEESVGPDYEDDTQYAGAPEGFAAEEPAIDQTQEMTIDSVSDEARAGHGEAEVPAAEAEAGDESLETGPATEEVPMLTDEAAALVEAQAAEEMPIGESESVVVGDEAMAAPPDEGDVDFGDSGDDSESATKDPATELTEPKDPPIDPEW